METQIGTEFQEQITSGRHSALEAYRSVVYGKPGLGGLLWYELITGWLGPLTGAIGIILRRLIYRRFLASAGRGLVIGRNVTVRHPHKITIGSNVVIDDDVVLDAKGGDDSFITLHDNVVLSRGTVLSCKGGSITLGESANFAIGCLIHAGAPVRIGKYCLLASGCYLVGVGNHGFENTDIPMMAQPSMAKGLTLEDDVWLGAKVVVLDGVTIGTGSVVGACSLVNKSMDAYSIAVGAPARIIRKRG